MANNDITIGTKKFAKYKNEWVNKVGIFEMNTGEWIVRIVGKRNKPTTISRHKTKEEAESEFNRLNAL